MIVIQSSPRFNIVGPYTFSYFLLSEVFSASNDSIDAFFFLLSLVSLALSASELAKQDPVKIILAITADNIFILDFLPFSQCYISH